MQNKRKISSTSRFSKHKSKSCGELPFTRRRVGKLSSPHATPGILEKPLDHALSLRGRSMSAASFSTMDILPRITQNVPDERGNSKQDDGHGCGMFCPFLITVVCFLWFSNLFTSLMFLPFFTTSLLFPFLPFTLPPLTFLSFLS